MFAWPVKITRFIKKPCILLDTELYCLFLYQFFRKKELLYLRYEKFCMDYNMEQFLKLFLTGNLFVDHPVLFCSALKFDIAKHTIAWLLVMP